MRKNVKQWVLILAVVFTVSAVVAAVLFIFQILPDIRSGIGPGEPYSESWNLDMPWGDELDIELSDVNIVIRAYDGTKLEAFFDGTRRGGADESPPSILCQVEGDSVRIRESQWKENSFLLISWPWSVTSIQGTLTVRVPRTVVGDFRVDTLSGGIDVEEVEAASVRLNSISGKIRAAGIISGSDFLAETFSGENVCERIQSGGEVRLKSSSGSIVAVDVNGNSLQAELFSGELEITRAVFAGAVNISSSSGAVRLAEVAVPDLSADTFSGWLSLYDSSIDGTAGLSTSSGTIDLADAEVRKLVLESFSGDITLKGVQVDSVRAVVSSGRCDFGLVSGADVFAETFSGSFALTMPADIGFAYTADTFSGGVEIGYATWQNLKNKDKFAGMVGDGKHKIEIETSSGDISIIPAS